MKYSIAKRLPYYGWLDAPRFNTNYLRLLMPICVTILSAVLSYHVLGATRCIDRNPVYAIVPYDLDSIIPSVTVQTIEQPDYIAQADTISFTEHNYDEMFVINAVIAEEPVIDHILTARKIGNSDICYTFMGWQCITNDKSPQYKWRAEQFPEWSDSQGCDAAFDEEGFAVVDGRYVVATTNVEDGGLAYIGQKFDVVLADGTVIPCICGEAKSSKDANWTKYGHEINGVLNLIEFCVDKSTWYNTNHANPGRPSCHPEWAQKLDRVILY